MTKIVLLGKNGQVGWELKRALSCMGELIPLDRHTEAPLCGDLTNFQALATTIRVLKPDIIVNAAAYNAVDKAESEPEIAMTINAHAPGLLAREAALLGALFVHYSTDYVFDGSGQTPWQESDPVRALSVYGRSKQLGEQAIVDSGCKYLIFRTSWVYCTQGNNFIKTIARLIREKKALSVVDDQIGAPTGAELLADVTAHAIRTVMQNPEACGLYHLAPGGETSWYGYATFILDEAFGGESIETTTITPVKSIDYPAKAIRPLNSRLNTTKLSTTFSLCLPHWKNGVIRVLQELADNQHAKS